MDEKERILIVDDDKSTRRSLSLIFGKKGYETEAVGTGREAIEKAQERFFNLALLDIRLPDVEGIGLLAPLKEIHPDMVVIMVTGYASLETAVRALNEGASAYTTKPLNMDEVLATVEGALEKQRLVLENRRLYEAAQRELAERKRAEEALKRRATQLATLSEVGRQITSLLEPDPLLAHIVSLIREAFNYRYVTILLVDPATGAGERTKRLTLRASAGFEAEAVKELSISMEEKSICGWVATSGEPLLAGDVSQEPRYYPVEALADTCSELAVPIQVKGQVIGVLDVQSAELDAFDEDDIFTMCTLADQVAAALENARLFEAERQQRDLAEALEEAASAVSSTLNLDHVLDRILEQVKRVLAGDAFNVMLLEDDTARIVRWRGYEGLGVESLISGFAIPIAEYPTLLKMAYTGEPVLIADTTVDPDWVLTEGREWLRSYVGAPIQVGGVTVGFLNVNGTQPGQFGPTDARRLEAFADHAATAIENAQLYRELLNYAERLEERGQERATELQAQYARLGAVLRSTSDGIIVTDEEGEIVQTNPVADTWLTRTLSPADAARLRETVQHLAGRAEERPETILELTGLDLQLNAAPVLEPGAEGAATVVAAHDISHLKALERMKSSFVTNISHELRTPITTIKLYTALMQQTAPETWKKYVDVLGREAERLVRLVDDILQISRIDAGRLEMKPRPTPLNELTRVAVVSHQMLSQNHGLTLEHQPAEPGPVALVDPKQMMQALDNLVENAILHTPEGGRVIVSTGKGEAERWMRATVTVTDTGIGIPEEELPHIFERFFRGEKPRLMQVQGAGLGLAIVKEIVGLHEGRVTVESQVGEGTTFTIWLPLTD